MTRKPRFWLAVLDKVRDRSSIEAKAIARHSIWRRKNSLLIKPLCLITAKPVLYVANVKEDGFQNNPLPGRGARSMPPVEKAEVVAVCAAIEAEIAELDDEEKLHVPR